jgi:hypothetical protein
MTLMKKFFEFCLVVSAGAAAVLSGGLVGCEKAADKSEKEASVQPSATKTMASVTKKPSPEPEMAKMKGHGMKTLAVEKRVAFMSGHVAAGLALFRAGAPDQAAKHLLHPVSETHQAERAGIDALGFTAKVFEAVSQALDKGQPASEVEPMLQAAEKNMSLLQKNAGGDAKEIITYLMNTVVDEYTVGVTKGAITDSGEYQDAFGFSVVALRTAQRVGGAVAKSTESHLMALVALWPKGGPLADSKPTSVAAVVAQTAKVLKALEPLP